ncbi:hypothetical protein CERZMDRAFT_32688 [Cercospora zeae-maydis SCOH1-5]|uniref:Polysaccharide biosynthesis protein C-terminal domain-containing protein n=1 Tax=Cercospora zeae-maydis SCOH1-5 TaxID=717836 RepID=A0A6A6FTM9_9PEZI|nr:hypothetical protein CERZMDRAFT_32688 [Cercospora zeae-maydis SCOH1-5]
MSRAIPSNRSSSPSGQTQTLSRSFGTSFRSQSHIAAIAEESIIRDLEETDFDDEAVDAEDDSALSRTYTGDLATIGPHSMAGYYRRPSIAAPSPRPFLGTQQPETRVPLAQDYEAALGEERSLLRDNHIIPPKHPRRRENGHATETTGLLANGRDPTLPYGGEDTPENISKKWEEAVENGQIHTTWQRETKTLVRYSAPLILTFILQQSLTLTSVFTVGHIGRNELGAVSLGSMTANITGYSVYHGLTTSLDTLCAQAYGSGKKKLVGLQFQRMVFFLWAITIPIGIFWFFADRILGAVVPDQDIAVLAGSYLKVLIIGAPGYAAFEAAKRYVQAQGRFDANLYVLLFAAPLNVFMHWLFVWRFEWGFIGCPIAVVITECLMPVLLFLYVRFVGGMECWPGFTRKAWVNWGPMIRLALPGLVMVLAEFLAFEIITLASARISAAHLAANTVLQAVSVLSYQLPFPLSIAASTRTANLIGAGLPEAAKVTTKVAFVLGVFIGLFNMIALSSLRNYIPLLFSDDASVVALAAATLPINAAFQLVDATAAQCNGILRGLGQQGIGGYINLFAYYIIALPISFALGFGLKWELVGIWIGPAVGLAIVSVLEGIYIGKTDYEKASEEAARRNAVD